MFLVFGVGNKYCFPHHQRSGLYFDRDHCKHFIMMMDGFVVVLCHKQLMYFSSSHMCFTCTLQTENVAHVGLEWLPYTRTVRHLIFLCNVGRLARWKSPCCSQTSYMGLWT